LREQIEQMAGVIQRGYRIEAGALEISLDSQRRIAAIELRTNPTYWLGSELQQPWDLVDASVEFLVEYDSNGIASIPTLSQWSGIPGNADCPYSLGAMLTSRTAISLGPTLPLA
jgi:hypothetical protein